MRKKLLILSVISLVILCIILLRENILLKSKIEVDVNNAKRYAIYDARNRSWKWKL